MEISPKNKAKLSILNTGIQGNKATVDELRESIINLRFNDPNLPPEERAKVNALCSVIIGI